MIGIKKKAESKNMVEQDQNTGSESDVSEEFWREPMDDTVPIKKEGTIHILKSRCKGCSFCVEFCPKKVLVISEEINEKGYHPPEVKNPDACVYCSLCELICPDFAIYIEITKTNEDEINKKHEEDKSKDKDR